MRELRESAMRLDVKRVEDLLATGLSVNAPQRGGENEPAFTTMLHSTCGLPRIDGVSKIVELLLDARADVNPRSSNGCTPLIRACMAKNVEVTKVLLSRKADVSVRDDFGVNCLQYAMVLDPPREAKGALFGRQGLPLHVKDTDSSSDDDDDSSHSSMEGIKREKTSAADGSASALLVRELLATGPSPAVDRMLGTAVRRRPSRRGQSSMMGTRSSKTAATPTKSVPGMHSTASLASLAHSTHTQQLMQPMLSAAQIQPTLSAQNARVATGTMNSLPPAVSSMVSAPSIVNSLGFRGRRISDFSGADDPAWALGVRTGSAAGAAERTNLMISSLAEEPPLLTAVRLLNHEAASVLLEVARVEPRWLSEAVRGGSLDMVKALLKAEADPTAEDAASGESPLDLALREMNEDEQLLEALRVAAASRPPCVVEEELLQRGISRRSVAVRDRDDGHSEGFETSSGLLGRSSHWRRRLRRMLQMFGLLSFYDRLYSKTGTRFEAAGRACRALCGHRYFYCFQFTLFVSGLVIADMWALFDGKDDGRLDVVILFILAGFIFEMLIQAVGLRRRYMFTFYFYMDFIGAVSLVLDVQNVRRLISGAIVGESISDNGMLARAARAARLIARAGRFTRLVKILRFLPGFVAHPETANTAKALAHVLVTRLSTIAACLTILLVMILPTFELLTFPLQDWSLHVWTRQLADTLASSAYRGNESEAVVFEEMLKEFRMAFADKAYFPHTGKLIHNGTAQEIFTSPGSLIWRNSRRVTSGDLIVYFDFGGVHRQEAAISLAMISFTILAMLSFSKVISSSVTSVAMRPLEAKLKDVRRIGATIYQHVESMSTARYHRRGSQSTSTSEAASQVGAQVSRLATVEETELLDKAIRKLIIISKLFSKTEQPDDDACMYLGHVRNETTMSMQLSMENFTGSDGNVLGTRTASRIPRLGTLAQNNLFQAMLSWEHNVLKLDRARSVGMCIAALQSAADQAFADVETATIAAFVDAAASGYSKEPAYHNWLHAADVTHILGMLFHKLNRGVPFLSELDEFALLVSAVCHDIGHLGVNNEFLVKTQHELAVRYNDSSPLENLHCATMFDILQRPSCQIFGDMPKEQRQEVRSICVRAILHTDNVHHMAMVKKLQVFGEVNSLTLNRACEAYGECLAVGQALPCDSESGASWPTKELHELFREAEMRSFMRNLLLHFADINNTTRPFDICREWAILVLEEFFAQGDLEKQHGLPVAPLNDRERTNRAYSQIGFIDFFAAPFVFATVRVCAPLVELADQIMDNTRVWVQEWVSEATRTKDEVQGVQTRLKRLEERNAALRPQARASKTACGPRVSARKSQRSK